MLNFTIILPVFNDWKSLKILLSKIEKVTIFTKVRFKILVINDNSSQKNIYHLNKKKIFKEVKVLNLEKNIGSQRAIATGLKYVKKNQLKDDNFIIMDSDGEDDPKKIKEIVNIVKNNKKINIITINRTLRRESFFFSIFYEIHLLITLFFTLNYIRFGNFTYLSRKVISKIITQEELWFAYSATLKRYFKIDKKIKAPRKKRIDGKSKMSYLSLIGHSLNIQYVFRKNIIFLYLIYSIFFLIFNSHIYQIVIITVLLLFFLHNLLFHINERMRVNKVNFNYCLENIRSIQTF